MCCWRDSKENRPRDKVRGFPVVLENRVLVQTWLPLESLQPRQIFSDEPHMHTSDPIKGQVTGTQACLHGSSIFPTTPSI